MNVPYKGMMLGKVNFGWISESWQLFATQSGVWIICALIYIAISVAAMMAIEFTMMFRGMIPTITALPAGPPGHTPWVMGSAIGIAELTISAFFGGGLLKMANKQVRGFPITASDLFSGKSTFLPLLACGLVLCMPCMILSGAVMYPMMQQMSHSPTAPTRFPLYGRLSIFLDELPLDIVPSVLMGLFWPAAALIADGDGLRRAFARSWQAMKSQWQMAILFMLVMTVIVSLSGLLCGLSVFVAIPMLVIIASLMYRDMIGMPRGEAPPE